MATELEKRLTNFHLSEEEESIIKVEDDDVDVRVEEIIEDLGVVGSLQGTRSPGAKFMKTALIAAWKTKKDFVIQPIGERLYAFQFFSKEDREKALYGGPWHFDNQLIILKPVERDKEVSELDFTETDIWVRIRKLPPKMRTVRMAEKIGALFGSLKVLDADSSEPWSNYMRIRVSFNVTKPLRRGVLLSNGAENIWYKVAYEKLPNFCYNCGILGHLKRNCKEEILPDEEAQYGGWLRANSPVKKMKSRNKSEVERLALLWSEAKQSKTGDYSGESTIGKTETQGLEQPTIQIPPKTPRRRLFDLIKAGNEKQAVNSLEDEETIRKKHVNKDTERQMGNCEGMTAGMLEEGKKKESYTIKEKERDQLDQEVSGLALLGLKESVEKQRNYTGAQRSSDREENEKKAGLKTWTRLKKEEKAQGGTNGRKFTGEKRRSEEDLDIDSEEIIEKAGWKDGKRSKGMAAETTCEPEADPAKQQGRLSQ
ncbi:unnamed protein product [Linum trigynum]|uniref:CCHC-type domain-containing protein n=1 Tax=Linum trigynum TaxID=586398 RepID=A0AAV2EWH9_9ROSI